MLIPVNRYGTPPSINTVPLRLTNAVLRFGEVSGDARRRRAGLRGVGADVLTGGVAESGTVGGGVELDVVEELDVDIDDSLRRLDSSSARPTPGVPDPQATKVHDQ